MSIEFTKNEQRDSVAVQRFVRLRCEVTQHRIPGYPAYWALNIHGKIWGDYGHGKLGKANAEEALRHIRPVLDAFNRQGWLSLPNDKDQAQNGRDARPQAR